MKRTLGHCGLITKMGDNDSPPNQHDGKCDGYAVSEDDELCYICKECELNAFYEENRQCFNYIGSSGEAELERLYHEDDSEGGLISED